jgi:hypothetical protein
MGNGEFVDGRLAKGLFLRRDSATHGTITPTALVSLAEYQADLAETREEWVIDEE